MMIKNKFLEITFFIRSLKKYFLTQDFIANQTQIYADSSTRHLRSSACNLRPSAFKKGFFRTPFITLFIFSLFITDVFAVGRKDEFKEIEEIEKMEKTQPPETIVRPKVEYKAANLRDPFQSLIIKDTTKTEESRASEAKEKTLPTLTVQGLIWGGSFPQAIINNKVVKVGDTIEGAQIISIDKHGIIVYFEGRQYNLTSPAAGVINAKAQK